MIDAYKAGYPDKGKPFPDGAKMAKVHWTAKVDVGESVRRRSQAPSMTLISC
jgi:hypothetical protein